MTHIKILINSLKTLKEMNLPLKVDKLDKYDKCIKKLRENSKKILKNRATKKSRNNFF